jgi:hypothetical protein
MGDLIKRNPPPVTTNKLRKLAPRPENFIDPTILSEMFNFIHEFVNTNV